MFAIFTKELSSFFSSLTGYLVAVVFFALTGLFMWVFPGALNVLDSGYATLDPLFTIAPWVFLFLVPAVTMRSFSEEKKTGTIELILTRPISDLQLVMGKLLAAIALVVLLLVPTLIYFASVYALGSPVGNIDTGGTWGSFIGLLCLAMAYASIGVFTSSTTDNQIVAFIMAVVLCLLAYSGISRVGQLGIFAKAQYLLTSISIEEHYSAMSRGVIDTRDLAYFAAICAIFVVLTRTALESRKW
ncbi:MAG: gliding motility-associated ABC transporter permease subunit GldF [Bacteroidales bacterium]|nr:gliding motility-associated ABC transporter permease subunit GldF [Bacteroidales bacterium]